MPKAIFMSVIRWVIIFIFLSAGVAAASEQSAVKAIKKSAKCYKLISGKNNEMCQLFEQNLNRFCNEPPMVCDRKIHPDFAQYFSFPKWEEVDPEKHVDLIAEYIRIRSYGPTLCAETDKQCQAKRDMGWQEYRVKFFDRLKKKQIKLSRARFNAKGFGDEEQIVYKLVDFRCAINDEFWNDPMIPHLFVFDEQTGKLDRDYTTILGNIAYEVFFYKGETQLSTWDGCAGCSVDKIIIGYPIDMKCEIRYTGKKRGKTK